MILIKRVLPTTFGVSKKNVRNAGLGKGRHHNINHIDISIIGTNNTLETRDDKMFGNAWLAWSEEITRSNFIICQ